MIHLLKQTIAIYTPSQTPNVDGKQVWSFSRVIKCRFTGSRLINFADKQGEDKIIGSVFQIAKEKLEEGTIIKYLDDTYKVISCQEWRGFDSTKIFGSYILTQKSKVNV